MNIVIEIWKDSLRGLRLQLAESAAIEVSYYDL